MNLVMDLQADEFMEVRRGRTTYSEEVTPRSTQTSVGTRIGAARSVLSKKSATEFVV